MMDKFSLLDAVDILWINVSPALKVFNQPFLRELSKSYKVATWDYTQSLDEGASLDNTIQLLHEYLSQSDRPLHLMGHGTGGLLALLYAYNYPKKIKSLTLFSVGAYPAIDWQAHYYAQLRLLPCPRTVLLKQTVYNLFGIQSNDTVLNLINLLEQDLQTALSLHTLYQTLRLTPKGITVPLMVCCSEDDVIIDPKLQKDWRPWMKQTDHFWQCPEGRYFFHYFYPQKTAEATAKFVAQQEVYDFFSISA
ncbi:hypothetical protein Lepto7376_1366 [[Leptolyngbya] sp. PCC 7376]|uniref:alpha/beta fold hydrolase n=1 Tax=[Leptolyngbya] sp. PCC 7376 TaxID=111781 RepID=UPI00029F2F38|nr:alpha/beta hydrolase [[Leptolyngbya] sp. PCC 7376]AFY37718.1 hypothetical protein Lepto7376_1366 [[Leptolyngbya] sp. PCC 7376]